MPRRLLLSLAAVPALLSPAPARAAFGVSVPTRADTGQAVEVTVRDDSGAGGSTVQLCRRGPGGTVACRNVRFAPGQAQVGPTFRALRPGTWKVEVTAPDGTVFKRTVEVRNPGGRFRILATGDSMIQIIDSFLVQRLDAKAGVEVRSDAHISTGISKPSLLDWGRHAARQVRAQRPDAVVMFLGANDGFNMRTRRGVAPCCGSDWIAEYSRRARRMMETYSRRGRTRVYWLLLPTPRGHEFARVFRGVNAAIEHAARRHRDTVQVIDLRRTFTPGGRFRRTIRRGGRTLVVRQGDGVHLSVPGARIAAGEIERAMRADGLPLP